jgi:predicted transcriptional regulator
MEADFSKPTAEFIDRHIHSIAQLEVLLALHQDADAYWTIEQITGSFYLQPQTAKDLLLDLLRRGLVLQHGAGYRISYDNDTIRRLIEELAKLYRERRVAVISRIFSKSDNSASKFPRNFGSTNA